MNQEYDIDENDCRLNDCLFFSSAKLARVLGKTADDAFSKTGLSPSHALLLYIVNQNGEIHQKEIGERLHLTPSTITRFVEKLEGKRLVSRKTNGKNVYICTTEKGLLLQSEIIIAWNDLHAVYEDILTEDETRQFIEISRKLLEKLEKQKD
mgnify:CR=1 FL=1